MGTADNLHRQEIVEPQGGFPGALYWHIACLVQKTSIMPTLWDNGLTAFPFDTKGALVYNSGVTQNRFIALTGHGG
jgi:hypothetical protein